MAGVAPFPSTTCMIIFLFFSFLLASHFAMAVPKNTFIVISSSSSSTSTRDYGIGIVGTSKKKMNTKEFAPSSKEDTTKMVHMTKTTKKINNNNVQDLVLVGPKGGRRSSSSSSSRASRQWRDKIFNASEHEVPSGPNPISN